MTFWSSLKSSQALVPVVTCRSSRAPAWTRAILRSDTGLPSGRGLGPVDRNDGPRCAACGFHRRGEGSSESAGCRGFETGAERPPQPPVVEEVALAPPVVEEVAQQPSRNPG